MNTRTGRILVVDDDPELLQSFEIILMRQGYQADSAQDGAEALSLLDQNPYDLVLMDLKMPNMDGLETLSAIKEHAYSGRVVLMTGTTLSGQVARAIRLGIDGVLYKPFQVDRIVENLMQGNPVQLHMGYLQSVWNRMTPIIGAPTAQAVFQKTLDKFHQEQQEKLIKVTVSHEGFTLEQLSQETDHAACEQILHRSLRQLLAEVYGLLSMLTGNVFEESIIEDLSNHLKSPLINSMTDYCN